MKLKIFEQRWMRRGVWVLVMLVLTGLFSMRVTEPFWGHHEFNGVFYSMIADNYLRYGLAETRGAQVTNFYEVAPEKWAYHTHHPATFPLMIAGWRFTYEKLAEFRIFGSLTPGGLGFQPCDPGEVLQKCKIRELDVWVRLLTIGLSVAGVLSLIRFGFVVTNSWPASIFGGLIISTTPLLLYYSSVPVFETWMLPAIGLGLFTYWNNWKKNHDWWTPLIGFFLWIFDWPGFWFLAWVFFVEVLARARVSHFWLTHPGRTMLSVWRSRGGSPKLLNPYERRMSVLGLLVAGVLIGFGLIVGAQELATGNGWQTLLGAGAYRLSAVAQPYTMGAWIRTLISRTVAFWGLPLLLVSGLGMMRMIFDSKRRWFLLLLLGLGWSHILVFRNITWYHDYMLYHTIPLVAIGLMSFFSQLMKLAKNKLILGLVVMAVLVLNVLETKDFYLALVRMRPHKKCVQMGKQVAESKEQLRFQVNQEEAKICPPFTGYYGQNPFKFDLDIINLNYEIQPDVIARRYDEAICCTRDCHA